MNNISNSLLRILIVEYLKSINYTYDPIQLSQSIEFSNIHDDDDKFLCINKITEKFFDIISYQFDSKNTDYNTISLNDLIKNHRKVIIKKLLTELK
jgi:hypothetical protein